MYKVLSTEPSTKEGRLTEIPLAEAEIKKPKSNKNQKQDVPIRESLTVPKGAETASGGTPWSQNEHQTPLVGRIKGSSGDRGGGCTTL